MNFLTRLFQDRTFFADSLIQILVVSFLIYLPVFVYSIRLAKQKRIAEHRRVQTLLWAVLAVIVVIFEISVRIAGGADQIFRKSSLKGTWLLDLSFYVHFSIATFTFLFWSWLLFISRRKSGRELPGKFSSRHRIYGYVVFAGLILTTVTCIELYIVGTLL